MGLLFFNVEYPGAQHWEAQGLRAGWLTIAQFPLILLLAGKRNLIGYAVGISYERLHLLHRWVARVMLLTATIHGGVQAYGWQKNKVLKLEIDTDSCIPTGKMRQGKIKKFNARRLTIIKDSLPGLSSFG